MESSAQQYETESDKYIAGSRTYPGPQPYKLGCSGSWFHRKSYAKLKNFKHDTAKMRRIIEAVQKEVEGNNKEIQNFVHKVEELKSRLVQARVRSRIAPMLTH